MSAHRPRHWRFERDADGIAWLTLDRADSGTNTLGAEVLIELEWQLDALDAAPPRGLVLRSGKDSGFIAGADVREFDAFANPDDIAALIRRVHALFARIETAPWPVACVIRGHCLGGGLELALACHWRIAHDVPATRLGFPEVRLGIFPGFGGTWRATRRLGGPAALGLMLTSRTLSARAAHAAGLVDAVASAHESPDWLARRAVLAGRRSRAPGLLARLSNSAPARALLAPLIRRQTAKQARPDHYPAPYALIEHWRAHGGDGARLLADQLTLACLGLAVLLGHIVVYGWPLGYPLPGPTLLLLPFLASFFLAIHGLLASLLAAAALVRRR